MHPGAGFRSSPARCAGVFRVRRSGYSIQEWRSRFGLGRPHAGAVPVVNPLLFAPSSRNGVERFGLSDQCLGLAALDPFAQKLLAQRHHIPRGFRNPRGQRRGQPVGRMRLFQAGQPVLDILDDSALDAEFIVPSGWVRAIKPGMPIQVTVDETRRTYTAKVSRIGAKVDAVSHSVKVVAEIRGDFPELIAGMTGRVQMPNPTP